MKIKGNNSNFEACPEFTGKAVCVDVTPLRKQQSQFGERDVFKLVFEVDLDKPDGSRFCVWSHNFTPSLNEKANFRKFLRAWFGRDLMESEMAEFDTETMIGKPAQLVVTPYLDTTPHGLSATRAPCRPNPIGLSAVRLLEVRGNLLSVEGLDILDGTPLLDIKPYIPAFDAFEAKRIGWCAEARAKGTVADGRFETGGGRYLDT